eukprot:sb/3473350/
MPRMLVAAYSGISVWDLLLIGQSFVLLEFHGDLSPSDCILIQIPVEFQNMPLERQIIRTFIPILDGLIIEMHQKMDFHSMGKFRLWLGYPGKGNGCCYGPHWKRVVSPVFSYSGPQVVQQLHYNVLVGPLALRAKFEEMVARLGNADIDIRS